MSLSDSGSVIFCFFARRVKVGLAVLKLGVERSTISKILKDKEKWLNLTEKANDPSVIFCLP